MTTRSAVQINLTGIDISAGTFAAAAGDKFKPAKNRFLLITNADSSSHTATVATPNTVQGQAIADVACVVPAGKTLLFGPFPPEDFAGSDGLAAITWSATTSMTWAPVSL